MKNRKMPSLNFSFNAVSMVVFLLAINSCAEDPSISSRDHGGATSIASQSSEDALSHGSRQQTFVARLTGEQERPVPVTTDGSGQAIFKLSKDGTMLSYKLIVNNVEEITQAHIHCGDATVAGPVIAFLFGFDAAGVTVNGVLAEGVITSSNVVAAADSQTCSGGVATFEELIQKLQSGEAYVNVHTLTYPGGEIRGAIK